MQAGPTRDGSRVHSEVQNSFGRTDSQPTPQTLPAVISSDRLFGNSEVRELVIQHNGQRYRLRRTRRGNLILHK